MWAKPASLLFFKNMCTAARNYTWQWHASSVDIVYQYFNIDNLINNGFDCQYRWQKFQISISYYRNGEQLSHKNIHNL